MNPDKTRRAAACPECGAGGLAFREDGVSCSACARTYPLSGGAPLLLKADSPFRGTYVAARERAEDPSLESTVRRWLRWPPEDLAARIAAADPPILSDDYAPVDRLLFPVLEASQ